MLNKEGVDKEIDLSDHRIVLGSGLNAVATIHGISDSLDSKPKKIYVLDAGLTRENDLTIPKKSLGLKTPSPKFKIKANHYVYKSFKSMLGITEQGFEVVGSLAKGGLSNIWGATIQPYNSEELSKFPYSYEEIKNTYTKIYQTLVGSKNEIFIENSFKNQGFVISDPLLAINRIKDKSNSCHLESCDDGCISCNKNIFNSKNEIDNLISLNKIEYMPNLFIKSILLEDGFYFINCLELSSQKIILIKASTIYCCLGAISTSKIVLGMSKDECEMPLLSTPGGSFFMFSFKKFHKKSHKILSSKSFKGKLDSSYYEGNIFPFSKNLICTYFGERIGRVLNFIFRKLLFSRLFIANIYFDSDMSSSKIIYTNKEFKINASTTPKLRLIFKKVIKEVRKQIFSNGLLVIPFSDKLLLPGQDIHYGGSIPMKKNPQKNECNLNGELDGYKNFYISDSSSMPFLASKGQSFNSMVNAYYIASKSVAEPTQLD